MKAYFEKLVSLQSVNNALVYQIQKDKDSSLDSFKNIEALHNTALDTAVIKEKLASYKNIIKGRFPNSYLATVVLA